MRILDDEFDYRETSNWRELTDIAVALFVGLTALDMVSIGSDGGDSANDEGWRDRKDEDEQARAHRCARAAAACLGKNTKSGKINRYFMTNTKYDYSEDMPQPGSVTDGNEGAQRL